MRHLVLIPAVGILAIALTATVVTAHAARDDGAPPTVEQAFDAAATWTTGQSRRPLIVIEEAVIESLATEPSRADMEGRLLTLLTRRDASRESRAFVCRQLALVGSNRSVPVLEQLLADAELSHMARYALEVIPGDAAGHALLKAARVLDGPLRAGVQSSVAARLGPLSVSAIQPGAEASQGLTVLDRARRAELNGAPDRAAALYRMLLLSSPRGGGDLPPQVRYAALFEWARLHPRQAGDAVLALLVDEDEQTANAAARIIIESPAVATASLYAERLPFLPPHAQVRLVTALADRGDRAAADAVASLMTEEDEWLRDAAIRALGAIGTADHVPELLTLAAAGSDAAVSSLERLRGSRIDRALVSACAAAPAEQQVVIAQALGARHAVGARHVLEDLAANGRPPAVRTAAWLALARLEEGVDEAAEDEALAAAADAAATPAEQGSVLDALHRRAQARHLPLAMGWIDDDAIGSDAAEVALVLAAGADPQQATTAMAAIERIVATHPDDAELRVAAGAAMSRVDRDEGFIRTWTVAGPYVQEGLGGGELFDLAFLPEPGPDSHETQWQPVEESALAGRGIVDLNALLGGDDRVAYLSTVLDSDRDQVVRLEIGSDDGVKVWVNREVVHANNVMRGLTVGQDVVRVPLRAGHNVLLMKITQGGGDWQACCRVRDADGFRVSGISIVRYGRNGTTGPAR